MEQFEFCHQSWPCRGQRARSEFRNCVSESRGGRPGFPVLVWFLWTESTMTELRRSGCPSMRGPSQMKTKHGLTEVEPCGAVWSHAACRAAELVCLEAAKLFRSCFSDTVSVVSFVTFLRRTAGC